MVCTIHISIDDIEARELLIAARHRIPMTRIDRTWLRRQAIRELRNERSKED